MNRLYMDLGPRSYPITVGEKLLSSAGEHFRLDRKVFFLTDDGVPKHYAETILAQCKEGTIYTVAAGEQSKTLATLERVLTAMLDFGMTRGDALVAVGGGMVGDLGGFAAASFMRGIDFYQVPTTLLAQVDSSIGGKTGVNVGGVKNIAGAFYQPKAVLVDLATLATLPRRLVAEGMAEVVKMALSADGALFAKLEMEGITAENAEAVITAALQIKKSVVEQDEREAGLRKILNFGHTLGHGIEAAGANRYHGECVALGMLPMCGDAVFRRLVPVLKKLGLPTAHDYDVDAALSLVTHDKKCSGGTVDAILVDEVGRCKIEKLTLSAFENLVKERLGRI